MWGINLLVSSLLAVTLAAKLEGPSTIDELVKLAYPDGKAPKFVTIDSPAQIAIANNKTAILKVDSLNISPYPLEQGHNTFRLGHSLTDTFPSDANLHVIAFDGNEKFYEGDVPICEYIVFAKLDCPLKKYPRQVLQKILDVPSSAQTGRYSFVAKVTTPEKKLIADIAAIIDIVNEVEHNEL